MRLFIAINFEQEIKNYLVETITRLKSQSVQGNFTREENLHLTVIFLGEVSIGHLVNVKQAMDKITARSFLLNLNGFGYFKRSDGDIYWVGVEDNETLLAIYNKLYQELTFEGFTLEKRLYKPHLTLGRKIVLPKHFKLEEFSQTFLAQKTMVDKISLMKSERINGKLIYTEIYAKDLVTNPK